MEHACPELKGRFIQYVPSLNAFTKTREASLILARMEYWFESLPEGFYKFMEPCAHPLYRPGDSWTEELGMSRGVFNRAFAFIGVKYKSKSAYLKTSDPFQGKWYACYQDRKTNQTYFVRNQTGVQTLLQKIPSLSENTFTLRSRNSDGVCSFTRARSSVFFHKKTSCISILGQDRCSSIHHTESQNNKDIVDRLKKIWQEEIGPLGPFQDGKRCVQRILEAFRTFFEESLEKWRAYCKQIASSPFLMGKKTAFRAWLIWAVKGEVIERIRKAEFEVQDPTLSAPARPVDEEALSQEIQELSEPEAAREVRKAFIEEFGPKTYVSQFQSLVFAGSEGSSLFFATPEPTHLEWLKAHALRRLSNVLSEQRNRWGIEFVLRPGCPSLQKPERVKETETETETDRIKKIWQEEIGPEGPPQGGRRFEQRLLEALQSFFRGSLEEWRAYCRQIASSRFLMGEKTSFRAWLAWAIQGEVIERVRKAEFDIGDRTPPVLTRPVDDEALAQEIQELPEPEAVREVRKAFIEEFGVQTYAAKFQSLVFKGSEASALLFSTSNPTHLEWLKTHVLQRFNKVLSGQKESRAVTFALRPAGPSSSPEPSSLIEDPGPLTQEIQALPEPEAAQEVRKAFIEEFGAQTYAAKFQSLIFKGYEASSLLFATSHAPQLEWLKTHVVRRFNEVLLGKKKTWQSQFFPP